MIVKNKKPIAQALLVLLVSIAVPANTPQSERFGEFWGSRYAAQPGADVDPRFGLQVEVPDAPSPGATPAILRWNAISIDASGLDHTPVAAGRKPGVWGTGRTLPGGQGDRYCAYRDV